MSTSFAPEVVEAVCRHMNEDHVEDSLLIVRSIGGAPDASDASMVGLDDTAAIFSATVDGATTEVRVPWSEPVTERAQIRVEVVRMYHEACTAAGIEPRAAGEH